MHLLTLAVIILLLSPYVFVSYVILSVEEPAWGHSLTKTPVPPKPTETRTLVVDKSGKGDYTSINEAVAASKPGDRIIVMRGVYTEEVVVNGRAWLAIEGVDREGVVLDGGGKLGNGIYVVFSPHVRVSNLTVKNYLGNGIFYVNSDYFEVSNITALNNRVYGVNFLASEKGIVSHVVAAGSGDSGIYVGEVTEECECVVEYSEAFNNSLGYSGTRANGVIIRNSYFHDNAIGIAPNTLLPNIRMFLSGKWPLMLWASKNVIENNVIENNNNRRVEAAGFAASYGVPVGVGIAMIGSHSNIVRNNVIRGNGKWGVAEWYFLVPPLSNVYEENVFERNGVDFWRDGWGFGSCSTDIASGDVPPPCSIPSFLRLTLPNPLRHLELILKLEVPHAALIITVLALALTPFANGSDEGASWRRRLMSSFIDSLVAANIYLAVAAAVIYLGFGIRDVQGLVDGIVSMSLLLLPLAYFIWAMSWVVYGLFSELAFGMTLGKFLQGLSVVRNGLKPGPYRLVARNIARYADLLLFGLVGIVCVLLVRKSLGDIASGTVVVVRQK